MSSMSSVAEQKNQMSTLELILTGNKILYSEIDCSIAENKALRDKYFAVSSVRGNYPQVFLQDPSGDITYLGSFDFVHVRFSPPRKDTKESHLPVDDQVYSVCQELNELNDLPQDVIDKNNIKTLNSVFAGTIITYRCWCGSS